MVKMTVRMMVFV